MRRREEQRRRFHEALINMLYPPPPPEPSPPSLIVDAEWNGDHEPPNITPPEIPEDHESDTEKITSDDDREEEEGDGKMTRAQRKRLRKRKLKEDSTRRRKLIGPLLPVTSEEDDPQGVRPNVTLNCNARVENKASTLGDVASSGSGKKKLKQRRKARKLARTTLESADAEKLIGDADGGGRSSSSSETLTQN